MDFRELKNIDANIKNKQTELHNLFLWQINKSSSNVPCCRLQEKEPQTMSLVAILDLKEMKDLDNKTVSHNDFALDNDSRKNTFHISNLVPFGN